MKITDILQININKLSQRFGKALFLILPVTVLMALTVVVSSQVKNFQVAADKSIFGTVENQATLINLVKTVAANSSESGGRDFFNSDNQFTGSDLDKIQQIPNVKSASINSPIPLQRAITTDLFNGVNYRFSNIVEIDPESSSLYTKENFSYQEGKPVPIILNASTLIEQYEDWGGQNSISVQFNRGSRQGGAHGLNEQGSPSSLGPNKTRTISYDKNNLLGKTFTVSIGGFDPVTTFSTTPAAGAITFTKLPQAEIEAKFNERKAAIEKYWNYEKLSTPQTYTFKVAGIIESESDNKTYIPSDFADTVVSKYIQNQLDARNNTPIPATELNTVYRGMTYDGTELVSGQGRFGGLGRSGNFGANQGGDHGAPSTTQAASYTVPGLVVELSSDGQQTVKGIYPNANAYKDSVKKGQSISLKFNNVYNRTQVVKDLNAAGYAYQDLNNLDVFNNLKNTLKNISRGFTVAFISLSIAVIMYAMSKFVSESRKEIGIFRAIGMKKRDIVIMFTSQALLYSFVGYILGAGLGYILNIVSSGAMRSWFDSLVLKTVKETFNVVTNIDAAVFSNVDVRTIGLYSVALLLITFFISIIPALNASNISPIEAINKD